MERIQASQVFLDFRVQVSHSSNVKDVVFDSILYRTYLGYVNTSQEAYNGTDLSTGSLGFRESVYQAVLAV